MLEKYLLFQTECTSIWNIATYFIYDVHVLRNTDYVIVLVNV